MLLANPQAVAVRCPDKEDVLIKTGLLLKNESSTGSMVQRGVLARWARARHPFFLPFPTRACFHPHLTKQFGVPSRCV